VGGQGDDGLYGGEGYDTYVYNVGDGHDIYDFDKKGRIVTGNDKTIGNVYQQKADTKVYTTANARIEITHHSPWQVVFEDGGTITLGDDFQSGDFGINLIDVPDDPGITLTITEYTFNGGTCVA